MRRLYNFQTGFVRRRPWSEVERWIDYTVEYADDTIILCDNVQLLNCVNKPERDSHTVFMKEIILL